MKKQLVFTQDFTPLRLPGGSDLTIAQCYRAGNLVYMTGQTGWTFQGVQVGVDDPAAQTRQAMENVRELMERAGGALADVTKLVVYVVDPSLRAVVMPIIASYFEDPLPCLTLLVVKGLARPDMLVEIDAWGFLDDAVARKQVVAVREAALPGMERVRVAAECVRAGRHIFLRGQTGLERGGELVGVGDPAAQARQACENLETLMSLAGGSLRDVVRITYHVTEREHRLQAYPVVRQSFGDLQPCGTGVVMPGLERDGLLIALDAWEIIDDGGPAKQVVRVQDLGPMGMPGSAGLATQCIRAGNVVHLQGQTGFTLDGELVGVGDPAAQARQACENLETLMSLAGGSLRDVVRLVVYVTDRAYREGAYPTIRGYFSELWPCGTGVVAKGLARPELLVEIDAWAFIDDPA